MAGRQLGQTSAALKLHVRSHIFDHGVLTLAPVASLHLEHIQKLVLFAKAKAPRAFPRLSFQLWQKWAADHIKLTPDLCWTYFETFETLFEFDRERLAARSRLAVFDPPAEHAARLDVSVNIWGFAIFLYMQRFGTISLRSALEVATDVWPANNRSHHRIHAGEDDERSYAERQASTDSERVSFVLRSISELLQVLADSESLTGDASDARVSAQGVAALALLLRCVSEDGDSDAILLDKARQQSEIKATGYSKIAGNFLLTRLASWIRDRLVVDEALQQNVDAPEHRPLLRPTSQTAVISFVSKRTIYWSAEHLSHKDLVIQQCNAAFIYVLSPLRHVVVNECRNCTIVLGPSRFVTVTNCKKVDLLVPCRLLTASTTRDCALRLHAETRPILLEGSQTLLLGPFGVSYDRLADHMGSVGLCCELNLWDNPLTVISKGPHSSSYVLEQPEQFQPWLVPFGSNGHAPLATPNDLACPLPPAFTQAVEDRIAFVKYFRSKLQGIDDVDEDLRRAFTANIESRFTDWLNESGHDRQLQDLLTMDHHPASGEMASQQRHGSRPGSASPGTRRHRMPAQVAAVSASAGVDV
eukprot:m.47159 g.47159  ORF g.47159 m.47159 type:complete len:586 (+) comp11904_c0_seq4:101-1858(+)